MKIGMMIGGRVGSGNVDDITLLVTEIKVKRSIMNRTHQRRLERRLG